MEICHKGIGKVGQDGGLALLDFLFRNLFVDGDGDDDDDDFLVFCLLMMITSIGTTWATDGKIQEREIKTSNWFFLRSPIFIFAFVSSRCCYVLFFFSMMLTVI